MMRKYFILSIVLLIFQTDKSIAQGSIMDEYSQVYLEKLIAVAKENYPRMNTYKSRLNIAKSNITSQKSRWLDGLSFNYVYKPNNTLDIVNPTFFNGYQVAISFSVTELFQKSSDVYQAKEALKIAQFDQDEYIRTIENQVTTRYIAYLYQKKLLVSQTNVFASARDINKTVIAKFSKGEATLRDYNDAQIALAGFEQSMGAAEAAWLTAKAALEELTVKKLEEIR